MVQTPHQTQVIITDLFRGSQHQDAHEFLNFLLNDVAEKLVAEEKRLTGT